MRIPRWLMLCGALGCFCGGVYTVHFFLGRPDRILNTQRHYKLLDVEAQLLHYESDHGTLPPALTDLIPNYMLESDLVAASGPLYRYDPAQRLIAQAHGTPIRGLYTRHSKAEKIFVPKPEIATSIAVTDSPATPAPIQLVPAPAPAPVPAKTIADAPSALPALVQKDPEPTPEIAKTVAPAPAAPVASSQLPLDDDGSAVAQSSATQVSPANPAPETQAPQPPQIVSLDTVAARARSTELPELTPLALRQPALPEAPHGSFVFEAEHFSETTYGWEAHVDPTCSGGAYLHCKEGIANNSAQVMHNVGNFYDLHTDGSLRTSLKYHFKLPAGGTYYCYGRMWTTDTHCSNHLCLDFDSTSHQGSIDNRTPFRWLWTPITNNGTEDHDHASPIELSAGDHYMNIYIWEDGIQLDQFILSPAPITGNQPYKPNLIPNRGTQFDYENGPAVHLSMDLKNAVIAPGLPPDAKLVIRKIRRERGIANLNVRLKNAGPNGADISVAYATIDVGALPEISFYALQFPGLDLEHLPRREYELTAQLTQNGKILSTFSGVLARPYLWETFGPGKYLLNEQNGPLDGDGAPRSGDTRAWTPMKDTSFDWFGVLDFGVHFGATSKHAPENSTVYARTTVHVATSGEYKIKVMADDQMRLWIDGEDVFRIDEILPVTRSARSFNYHLDAGDHRIRIRINQQEGPWQAFVRVRTADDGAADVVGVESKQ